MKKLILLAVVVLGFAATSFAQPVSATASATATIKAALAITKIVDLNFGSIYIPGYIGTVTIDAVAAGTRTFNPNTNSGSGTGAAAKFAIDGVFGNNPTVGFPPTLTLTSGANTMVVTLACKNSSAGSIATGGTVTLDINGKADIYIGGELAMIANQPVGIYKDLTHLTVTVNY